MTDFVTRDVGHGTTSPDVPSNTASAHIGPVDFGPVEVVVNGVRYVREETLFAALTELDELRAENERRDSQRKAVGG